MSELASMRETLQSANKLTADEFVMTSVMTIQSDGDIQSFQIRDSKIKDMLALNRLEGEFSERSFAFVEIGKACPARQNWEIAK
ncbi:MAG TPA: hypothetical protein PKD64_06930 [Pirellulaceae bacterium]|nr:hypothetical protein [Pirellulaceae bacterium]HMO91917.1 hypothetical protein [Pirellulaceae bacterium]HMP68717.1 hypothetical protein [Pirellulaceae bacterium]